MSAEIRERELLHQFTFKVEAGKIRELALAIGDDNPLYFDEEAAKAAGYRGVIAPPTFGTCVELWGGADFFTMCQQLGMNPVRVLHGEQAYSYFGEINPGMTLTVRIYLKNKTEKKGMRFFYLEVEHSNEVGEVLLVAEATVIERL